MPTVVLVIDLHAEEVGWAVGTPTGSAVRTRHGSSSPCEWAHRERVLRRMNLMGYSISNHGNRRMTGPSLLTFERLVEHPAELPKLGLRDGCGDLLCSANEKGRTLMKHKRYHQGMRT